MCLLFCRYLVASLIHSPRACWAPAPLQWTPHTASTASRAPWTCSSVRLGCSRQMGSPWPPGFMWGWRAHTGSRTCPALPWTTSCPVEGEFCTPASLMILTKLVQLHLRGTLEMGLFKTILRFFFKTDEAWMQASHEILVFVCTEMMELMLMKMRMRS